MHYIKQHAATIISAYDGNLPLAHFLKNYFKHHPKLGSRDRKMLAGIAYSWYRCAKGFDNGLGFEEKVLGTLLLCDGIMPRLTALFPEDWQQQSTLPLQDKIAFLGGKDLGFDTEKLFPFDVPFSEGISKEAYLMSLLRQPALFIRVRNNRNTEVEKALTNNAVPFKRMDAACYALPNGAAIDKLLPQDVYVVQDYSSQKTAAFFNPKPNESWWDCCAGAGGKSLLLKDLEPNTSLSVSDTRASILHNLQERFRQYHHKAPHQYVLDTANKTDLQQALGNEQFDNIICDVPCTGSGTWARTPEQLYFFKEALIDEYAARQKAIAMNVAAYLKQGGKLIYITCSIFNQENEVVVQWLLQNNPNLELKAMRLINGIATQADSMFAAVLKKR